MFDPSFFRRRALSHAYILTGGSETLRSRAAAELAAALVCTAPAEERPCGVCLACKKVEGGIHPDVITVAGEKGKSISVAQVRTLRGDAYVRPNEAERKVYVLENADQMNDSAQNAMLKLLEEGPLYAAFLLLAEQDQRLLVTVRSRCEVLRLSQPAEAPALSEEAQAVGKTLAEAYLTGDELGFLSTLVACEKWEREVFSGLMACLILQWRDKLVAQPRQEQRQRLLRGIEQAEEVRRACGYNASVGQLCGWLTGALFS